MWIPAWSLMLLLVASVMFFSFFFAAGSSSFVDFWKQTPVVLWVEIQFKLRNILVVREKDRCDCILPSKHSALFSGSSLSWLAGKGEPANLNKICMKPEIIIPQICVHVSESITRSFCSDKHQVFWFQRWFKYSVSAPHKSGAHAIIYKDYSLGKKLLLNSVWRLKVCSFKENIWKTDISVPFSNKLQQSLT